MTSHGFTIDSNFPGGNILLEKIDGNTVFLRQELRDTAGDWFYWAFRVRGAVGRNLNFAFTGSDVLGVRGAAISRDNGRSWNWLGADCVTRNSDENAGWSAKFSHNFASSDGEVILAFCPLYTQGNLDAFLEKSGDSRLQRGVLCHSRTGREVEVLQSGNPSAPFRLLLTARHHACETMASFCLEGFLEVALSNDELGRWLYENVCIVAVPFMDKDGVEAGDQGKNRKPYDHNRDYGGEISDSIYPEVRALRQWAPEWIAGAEKSIAIDLHCPWIRGDLNEQVYFVGIPDEEIMRRVTDFSHILETVSTGPLPYQERNNLPFGVGWNSLGSDDVGCRPCSRWAATLPGIHFAISLEVPYANAGGADVTPQSSRALGRDLAVALRSFLLQR